MQKQLATHHGLDVSFHRMRAPIADSMAPACFRSPVQHADGSPLDEQMYRHDRVSPERTIRQANRLNRRIGAKPLYVRQLPGGTLVI